MTLKTIYLPDDTFSIKLEGYDSGSWRQDAKGWWLLLEDGIHYGKTQWAFLEN